MNSGKQRDEAEAYPFAEERPCIALNLGKQQY